MGLDGDVEVLSDDIDRPIAGMHDDVHLRMPDQEVISYGAGAVLEFLTCRMISSVSCNQGHPSYCMDRIPTL